MSTQGSCVQGVRGGLVTEAMGIFNVILAVYDTGIKHLFGLL